MHKSRLIAGLGTTAFATSLFVLASCPPTAADNFNNMSQTQCLSGTADGSDYAEYDEDFATGGWKDHSGVAIASESQVVILSVTDAYGNSICSNTANLTTSCQFRSDFQSTFTIRVDNAQNMSPSNYQICAF